MTSGRMSPFYRTPENPNHTRPTENPDGPDLDGFLTYSATLVNLRKSHVGGDQFLGDHAYTANLQRAEPTRAVESDLSDLAPNHSTLRSHRLERRTLS
jgi:hypothetical protein